MGLALDDVDDARIRALCRTLAGDPDRAIVVRALRTQPLPSAQGVLSRYVTSNPDAIIGHHVLAIDWTLAGARRTNEVVVKSKAPGAAVRRALDTVYRAIDPALADAAARVSPSILDDCHLRELAIATLPEDSIRAVAPVVYGVWSDPEIDVYAIAMERLADVHHANTLDDLSVWRTADLDRVLGGIARVHGSFLGMSPVTPPAWLVPFAALHGPTFLAYQATLLRYNADRFPGVFDARRTRVLEHILASAPERHRAIAARPLTLIHGDFSPRNVCLHADNQPCIYDWELAQVHLPARDLCELLSYVLDPQRGWTCADTTQLLDRYRARLAAVAGCTYSTDELRHDLALAVAELCSFKLLVQGITHQLLRNSTYFERLVTNAFACIDTFGQGVIT